MVMHNIFDDSGRTIVASKDNVFANFLINKGLYDKIDITEENLSQLLDLIGGKVNIVVFCPSCNEDRVFHGTAIPYYSKTQQGVNNVNLDKCISNIRTNALFESADHSFSHIIKFLVDDIHILVFKYSCSMESTHRLDYVVIFEGNTMKKIGQFPSVADLTFHELKEFKRVIVKRDEEELKRAIGLYAHGIGIGSFVYLRRIVERIIISKGNEAIKAGKIKQDEFEKARVKDRIEMLKEYLPAVLVDNPIFYSIVSKGIHELSEEDCINYFPILESFIFLVLRQMEKTRKDKEDESAISQSLGKIYGEIE